MCRVCSSLSKSVSSAEHRYDTKNEKTKDRDHDENVVMPIFFIGILVNILLHNSTPSRRSLYIIISSYSFTATCPRSCCCTAAGRRGSCCSGGWTNCARSSKVETFNWLRPTPCLFTPTMLPCGTGGTGMATIMRNSKKRCCRSSRYG